MKPTSRKSPEKHGLTNHPIYQNWKSMLKRCYDPKCKSFKDYGARGIYVCEEWLKSVKAFHLFCISAGWNKALVIDRKDNNGPYCPSNCHFVTRAKSNGNKRNVSKSPSIDILKASTLSEAGYTCAQIGRLLNVSRIKVKEQLSRFRSSKIVPLEFEFSPVKINQKKQHRPKVTSHYKGVTKRRLGWLVRIKHNGIVKNLGTYYDEVEAARIYDSEAKKIYGRFAITNFSNQEIERGNHSCGGSVG